MAKLETRKAQLEAQLDRIREQEAEEEAQRRAEERYQTFKNRAEDWMIGRAHVDMTFAEEKYEYKRNVPMIPCSVSISGNCGSTYFPIAPLTHATKMYFHNVWPFPRDEGFQKRLTEFVQKEVEEIAHRLPAVLEMLGLQSIGTLKGVFPANRMDEVREDIDLARKEVLDRYSDEDFLNLIRHHGEWLEEDDEGEERLRPAYEDVDLCHSRKILATYIFKHRPSLWPKFSEVRRFQEFADAITKAQEQKDAEAILAVDERRERGD